MTADCGRCPNTLTVRANTKTSMDHAVRAAGWKRVDTRTVICDRCAQETAA